MKRRIGHGRSLFGAPVRIQARQDGMDAAARRQTVSGREFPLFFLCFRPGFNRFLPCFFPGFFV